MITTNLPNEFLEIFDEKIPFLSDLLEIDGVYLAGGLLRTMVSQDEVLSGKETDVDLFFRDGGAFLRAKAFIDGNPRYVQVYQCPVGKLSTYLLDNEWKIQLITVDFYSTVGDVVESFDFTVAAIGTDGASLVMEDTTIKDILDRRLIWNKITYPSSSLRRMIKYAKKGYVMEEEEYQHFVTKVWEHDVSIIDGQLVYVD